MRISILLDACLPEPCAVCSTPILTDRIGPYPLCRDCVRALGPPTDPRCEVCGCELISERRLCTRCREREYPFERNVSLFAYRGVAKRAVQAYKFHGAHTLSRFFADGLCALRSVVSPEAPVVPVPPRPRRRFGRRRADQVERIVRIMERRHRVPVLRLLEREGGRAQKELDYEERLRNLRDKFHLRSPVDEVGGPLVLLDDVFTTGATASECARVLIEGGATAVIVLTLAVD